LPGERAQELLELFANLEDGGLREQIEGHESAISEAKKKLEVLYINFAKEHIVGDDAEALEKLITSGWEESADYVSDEPAEFVQRSDAIGRGIVRILWDIEED
jgi:hypothetical protein